MTLTYIKSAFKNKTQQGHLIALILAMPLIFGFAYGLMYQALFASTSATSQAAQNILSSVVTVLTIKNPLSAIGKMQLSVFTGCTFFIVSLFASQFVKNRRHQFTNRLVAMGYHKRHVFLGEGLSYFFISLLIITCFNVLFIFWHHLSVSTDPKVILTFLALVVAQALFATAYALFALGTFKTEKLFSLFHFLPAFVIAFLGGSFFPVDQVATSGVYQWMPTYYLNKLYTQFYTLNTIDHTLFIKAMGAFGVCTFLLIAIGYRLFKLEEVAS